MKKNYLNKQDYIKVNLGLKTVDIIVEKRSNSNVIDYTLKFQHKTEKGTAFFVGFYNETQILISISLQGALGNFTLPEDLIGFSRARIIEGLGEYISRLTN